jgi:hypothetical protein
MMVAAAAAQMTVPWHHGQFLACSRNDDDGGSVDDSALALLAIPACSLNDEDGGVLFELQEAPATKYCLGVAHISMLKALEIRNFSF